MKSNSFLGRLSKSKGMKASLAFFVAEVISTGIQYLTTPIFTRLLTTEEYGLSSVYTTWFTVFGIVAMFSLSSGVFNNGMLDFENDRDRFSFSMLMLSNAITIIFSVALLLLYPYIKDIIGLNFVLVVLMCGMFFVTPAFKFWIARQRYEYKYKASFIFSIVCAVLSPVVAILCIYFSNSDKLMARLFGGQLTLAVIYIGFYVYLIVKSKGKVSFKYWKFAILFNLPLIPHYLSTYLLGTSNKLLINYLKGSAAAGFYNIAYSIAAVVTIIWSAANASLVPFTYEKCKENDYESISKVTTPILLVFVGVCFFVTLLAPEVVSIMASKDYSSSLFLIPPIIGGVFFQVQYYMYANILYYYKKTRFVMIGSVVSVLINIVANYFLIQRFGYEIAGYTTLVCYMIQATIDYLAMRYVAKSSVYNMKVVLALSGIVLALSFFGKYLYYVPIARYILIGVIVVLVIVFRKQIFKAFAIKKNETTQNEEELKTEINEE